MHNHWSESLYEAMSYVGRHLIVKQEWKSGNKLTKSTSDFLSNRRKNVTNTNKNLNLNEREKEAIRSLW